MIKQHRALFIVIGAILTMLIQAHPSAASSAATQSENSRESGDRTGSISESKDFSRAIPGAAVGPTIWNSGSLTFRKTAAGQEDCITPQTCLTRSTVLYNSVVESPTGQQPCPGYEGPANTTWAIGDISDWSGLTYAPLYDTNGCFPPGMLNVPMVAHLISEDIYLQVTFTEWRSGGGNFEYIRTTGPAAVSDPAPFDFDGDSKTDPSIFRPGAGEWWILRSSDSQSIAAPFGTSTDRLVPADYTGDGKTDIAFWRPSTGEWYVLRSEDSSFFSFPFGETGDIPAPGDFDGDGKTDAAVYRPSAGTWFIERTTGGTEIVPFGIPEDQPVVKDYDGDGKDDIGIYRPSVSEWWLNRSRDGVVAFQFGSTTDSATPADFTGDGKADVAFWRPSTGEWFVLRSEDSSFYSFPFGASGDIPAAGDYDGDGTTDPVVFRPGTSTWYKQQTSGGFEAVSFGMAGDIPVCNVYVVPVIQPARK